ncbi:MAG TPA: methionine biosynthesis protein MetW, partial [Pseudohaliea sp.]|nr:methionine biosynthesis protein MetW [Pseudohaliea sp.]
WYDTPNIHFCTVRDFEQLCAELGVRILARDMVGAGTSTLARAWPNLFAQTAIYHITRPA